MRDKQLLKKIENSTARVAILGMGYVGLPRARTFCAACVTIPSKYTLLAPRSQLESRFWLA